jgi:hypothetical protein
MRANWTECKFIDQRQVPWAGLYATLTRYGDIRLGVKTWQKLGEPKAVNVYFDATNNRFGLKPTALESRNAFPVRPKGTSGGRRIAILGVMREFRIDLPETVRFYDAEINDEGILILDLRTARVPDSVKGHPRNIARNREAEGEKIGFR